MLKRSVAFVGVFILVLAVFAGGCANQKAPAEAAIASAETAFAAVQAEAVKYLPEQATGVADAIAGAKAALGKGDYQAALTAAQALPAKISELSTAMAAKKAELTATWTSLSASMPKVVEVIQSRIGILSKSKALPAGLDAAKFDQAKSGLASLTSAWTEATTAFGAGNLTEAVAKAGAAKSQAVAVMNLLNMQVPAALQAEGK
jgi:hypothetical protein